MCRAAHHDRETHHLAHHVQLPTCPKARPAVASRVTGMSVRAGHGSHGMDCATTPRARPSAPLNHQLTQRLLGESQHGESQEWHDGACMLSNSVAWPARPRYTATRLHGHARPLHHHPPAIPRQVEAHVANLISIDAALHDRTSPYAGDEARGHPNAAHPTTPPMPSTTKTPPPDHHAPPCMTGPTQPYRGISHATVRVHDQGRRSHDGRSCRGSGRALHGHKPRDHALHAQHPTSPPNEIASAFHSLAGSSPWPRWA